MAALEGNNAGKDRSPLASVNRPYAAGINILLGQTLGQSIPEAACQEAWQWKVVLTPGHHAFR
jgi:hypothetical protein